MSKQILIELVGENETGYCYADLSLPAGAEEIEEAKEKANWVSNPNGHQEIDVLYCRSLSELSEVISALRIAAPFPSWRVSGWTALPWMN